MKRLILLALSFAVCGLASACGGTGGEPQAAGMEIGRSERATSAQHPALPPAGPGEEESSADDVDPDAPDGVGGSGGACAGTSLEPSRENMRAVHAATVCLLNVERSARRLSPLRPNVTLARASLRHARDMVANDYFSHDSRSGDDVLARVRREGYLRGSGRWVVGENLAFGTGSQTAPKAVVEAWMESPGHRSNILYRGFREIGIGIALGVPEPGREKGATYTTGFGAR